MSPRAAWAGLWVCAALLAAGLIWAHIGLLGETWRAAQLARGGQVTSARVLEFLQAPGPRGLSPVQSVRYEVPVSVGAARPVRVLPITAAQAARARQRGTVDIRFLPRQPDVQTVDGQGAPLGGLLTLLGIDLFLAWVGAQLWRPRRAPRHSRARPADRRPA